MALNPVNPDVYDQTAKIHRPMLPGQEAVNPVMVPLSARAGNQIINAGDGLYAGSTLTLPAYYVNTNTGVDASGYGYENLPFKTIDFAFSHITNQAPNSQSRADIVIALAAGQTFPVTTDFNIYGGTLQFAFYGDSQYGDFNSAAVGSGASPSWMSDLNRPIIAPQYTQNAAAQWYLPGINRFGGTVIFSGVRIQLPAAPPQPSITLYSNQADFVRSVSRSLPGYVSLIGSTVNISDVNAFWGFLGIGARTFGTTLEQFASQFLVNGVQMSAANAPSAAQLAARPYFIKMLSDIPGNNSVTSLGANSQNSSSGSGVLNLTWTDTEQLIVATGKTNLPSYPVNFDVNYGLRNYIFNMVKDQQSRPLNVISPRLI